jgi:hypothetical protein
MHEQRAMPTIVHRRVRQHSRITVGTPRSAAYEPLPRSAQLAKPEIQKRAAQTGRANAPISVV